MLKQKFEFGEKRMVFLSNPEVPKGLSESADTRREEFLKLLESKKIVELDAADIVRDNPLLDEIKIPDFEVKVFAHRPGEIELSAVDRKALKAYIDGKVNVSDGSLAVEALEEASRENNVDGIDVGEVLKKGPKNLTIDGLGYAALVWPEIHGNLVADLSEAGMKKDKIEAALRNYKSYPKLQELIIARAKALKGGGFVVGNLAVDAIKQIEVGAKLAALPAEKAADDAREKLRRDLNRSNSLKKFELSYSEDLPAITSKQLEGAGIGEWLDAKNMRENNVDSEKWNVSTPDGLAGMRYDLAESLHISINNSPWVGFFNELAKASDNKFLNKSGLNPSWFKEPVNYQALTSNGQESFVIAHKWFVALREQAMAISKSQQIYDEALQNKDKIPVLSTVVDEVKSNVGKLTDAIRTKDWATAAVYLAGIWGVYKIYKSNSDSGIGKFIKDSLPYLAVGGLGLMVAKNAGVDLLKMAGIRNAASAFDGTYIADLFDVKGIDLTKLDSEVLMDASQVKLGALWQAYKTPAAAGFVDPFSVDSTVYGRFGAMGGSLTDKRKTRDFDRTGKQLYELVGGVEKAYMATIFKDPKAPEYGISFDDLMKSEHGNSLLIDLMAKISKYTHRKLDVKGAAALNKRVSQIFDGHDLGPSAFVATKLNIASSKPGEADEEDEVLTGTVAGYPVVVIAKGDSYKIYDRAEFEAKGLGATALLTVPSEGEIDASVKGQVGKFGDVVKERAKALIEKKIPAAAGKLEWNGSHWIYKKGADPRLNNFGITAPSDVEVKVMIKPNGSVEEVETVGGVNDLLLKALVASKGFETLAPLVNKKMVEVVEIGSGAENQVKLKIADVEVVLKYKDGKFEFVSGQDELMKSEKFIDSYLEAWFADETIGLQKDLDEIFALIEGANASYVGVFEKLWSGSKDKIPTIGSSVPDHYSKSIIDVVKYHTVVEMKDGYSTRGFGQFVETARLALTVTKDRLSRVSQDLKNKGSEEWNASDFETRILNGLSDSPCQSEKYKAEKVRASEAFYQALNGWFNLTAFDESTHVTAVEAMKLWIDFSHELDDQYLNDSSTNSQKLRYLEYLKNQIVGKIRQKAILNKEGIKTFNEWRAENVATTKVEALRPKLQLEEIKTGLKNEAGLAAGRITKDLFKDRLKKGADGRTEFAKLFNDFAGNAEAMANRINAASLTRAAQEAEIARVVFEGLLKPVLEDSEDKYVQDEAIVGTVGVASRGVQEASARGTKFLKEKLTEVKNWAFDSDLNETEIQLPEITFSYVDPIKSDDGFFKALQTFRKGDDYDADTGDLNYVFDTDSSGTNLKAEQLVGTFKNLENAWKTKYDSDKDLFNKIIAESEARVEAAPASFDARMQELVEAAKEDLKKVKNQYSSVKKLRELLESKNYRDFESYCKDKFKK